MATDAIVVTSLKGKKGERKKGVAGREEAAGSSYINTHIETDFPGESYHIQLLLLVAHCTDLWYFQSYFSTWKRYSTHGLRRHSAPACG